MIDGPSITAGGVWLGIAALFVFAAARRSLTAWIVAAMALGAAIGYWWPDVGRWLRIFSQIFLRLIRTIIAPLLFGTLVVGIAGHANLKQVGRMGLKAIIYFEVVTTIALVIGLVGINLSQAGVGVQPPANLTVAPPAQKQSAADVILHTFPENIAKSVAEGQVLQIVVFSVLFGIGMAMLSEEKRKPMLTFAEGLADVMFKFTKIVMYLAPLGVGGAIAFTVAEMGFGILLNLAKLLATLYIGLIVFLVGVLLPIAWFARIPLRRFIAATAEPASIAFATSSSEAALPSAMESMEKMGVPRHIVAFVMPTGYSFNLDGSTLYLSMAAVFV